MGGVLVSTRSTWTSVAVRAQDVVAGEVVLLGGLAFTRLSAGGPLCKSSMRQKARYVEVMRASIVEEGQWIELMFRGGDSPANERVMFALLRPYEIVRVQVEKS